MTPVIRPARAEEYDEVARVWMNSWASTGIEAASDALLEKLRARVRTDVANGWSLYVADNSGTLAAMLALQLPDCNLDQLFVAPEYQGKGLGRLLMASRENMCRTRFGCAACARTKRHGAGMSARVLCSSEKLSRR